MITKEVGLSASPLGTVVVWECEDCHRRWTGVSRKPCPVLSTRCAATHIIAGTIETLFRWLIQK